MKRPKVRLGFVLEWTAAIAVGLGTMRWVDGLPNHEFVFRGYFVKSSVFIRGSSFLSGIALFECIILLLETLRGRRPSTWGIGRWVLGASGSFLMIQAADRIATAGLQLAQMILERSDAVIVCSPTHEVAITLGQGLVVEFPAALVLGLIAHRLARRPGDPAPDAREWSGRVFAFALLAWSIFDRMSDLVFDLLGMNG